uniref:ATP dependent DNA ligase n=1 Tax=Streptomyces sp. F12 TaxID=1436084 RepID=V9Z869_9ACTN|nr:ATP-dependent DNA ligase [Streptomyces sp. F12]AHE40199.1 ATP dependent DNA ligase [Streptomyces sp. F12]
MHLSPPVEPMLARSVIAIPASVRRPTVYEQKADGFRCLVFARPEPFLQSRRGANLTQSFPELARVASALGVEAVLDSELVVWGTQGLDFLALQNRARRRGAGAERAARERPAHLIVFDVLELAGDVLMDEPLRHRRAALERLFAARRLAAPWALCPQTTDLATAQAWMDPVWGAAGIEGVMIKDADSRYRPGERGWLKLRTRTTDEGIIGAVTGTAHAPTSLLLGRLDVADRLKLVARTTPLPRKAAAELGAVLHAAGPEHPWWGWRISAGWGSKEPMVFQPVIPELVAEVDTDAAVDLGRHRHPVRYLRLRADLTPAEIPLFGEHA